MTREKLIELAADELQVSQVGQSLSPEDQEKFDDKIDPLLANLAARGIVNVSDDEIPDEIADQIAILLAVSTAPTFGKPRDFALRDRVEEEIRVVVMRQPSSKRYLEVDEAVQPNAAYTYNSWLNDT